MYTYIRATLSYFRYTGPRNCDAKAFSCFFAEPFFPGPISKCSAISLLRCWRSWRFRQRKERSLLCLKGLTEKFTLALSFSHRSFTHVQRIARDIYERQLSSFALNMDKRFIASGVSLRRIWNRRRREWKWWALDFQKKKWRIYGISDYDEMFISLVNDPDVLHLNFCSIFIHTKLIVINWLK